MAAPQRHDGAAPTRSRSSSTDSAAASTNPPSPDPLHTEANHHLNTKSARHAIGIGNQSLSRTPRPRNHSPHDLESETRDHHHHNNVTSRGPLPRVASASRLLKHHHPALRPLASNRSVSFGKNLNKLASHGGHRDAAAVAAGGAAATPSTSRVPYRRAASSLTSPTYGSLGSARPSHHVKRNASAMVVSRGPAHLAALKKNLSSGQLQRHAKNAAKAAATNKQLPAPLSKQARAKGDAGQRGLRSPKSPTAATQAVRFDLGDGVAPGDETDDTEWVEDSTSISPVTTRDHTRHNSIILDPKAPLTASPTSEITKPPSHHTDEDVPDGENAQENHDTSPVGSAPKSDTIASRLLQRGATNESVVVSTVSATAVNTPTPQSTLSHSQGSTLNDDDSNESGSVANSGGRHLVSRFVNTNSTNGTPADLRGSTLLGSHPMQRNDASKSAEYQGTSAPGESHLRHRAAALASSKPAPSAGAPARSSTQSSHLPQSRTQQKLELQRASSVLETANKHHLPPILLPRPSAPQILHSGIHSFEFGFGLGEGDYLPAQIQSLYAQIGKEYRVVSRFRAPVEEALARLEMKHGGPAPHGGRPGSPSPGAAAAAAAGHQQKGKLRATTEPPRGRRLVDTDTPRAIFAAAPGASARHAPPPHGQVARAPNAELAYAKPHPHPHRHHHQLQQQHAHLGPSPLKSGHHLDREEGGAVTVRAGRADVGAGTPVGASSSSAATVTAATAMAGRAGAAAAAGPGRGSRVSFNVPAKALASSSAHAADVGEDSERDEEEEDEEEEDDDPLVLVASSMAAGRGHHVARQDEALEISRRLWDLGTMGRDDIAAGK